MGASCSFCITDWNSAVGMFLREASSCTSVSTLFFFSAFVVLVAMRLNSSCCGREGLNHLVELQLDPIFEISLDPVGVSELRKRPAAVLAVVVHAGHPVRIHRYLLFLRVLTPVTLDLDDQVQQIVLAVAVIHQHDKIRKVAPWLGAMPVRDFETEVVILRVRLDARVRFGDAAELGFPVAVEDHPVYVATAWIGLPAI